jgi:hypothetical protein
LNFIFGIVCLIVCVCAFSLRRESPNMILGDKPLIFEVVLSQLCCRAHWSAPHAALPCLLALPPAPRSLPPGPDVTRPHLSVAPFHIARRRPPLYLARAHRAREAYTAHRCQSSPELPRLCHVGPRCRPTLGPSRPPPPSFPSRTERFQKPSATDLAPLLRPLHALLPPSSPTGPVYTVPRRLTTSPPGDRTPAGIDLPPLW